MRGSICTICSSKKIYSVFEKGQYKILQCQECRFGVLNKYPTLREVKEIYQKDYFDDKKTTEFKSDAQKKFDFVNQRLPKNAKILDFGCGMGDFIGICQKNNHDVYGYDISRYVARFVAEKYEIPAYSRELSRSLFKRNQFDAIVSFDVIEHAPNFNQILRLFHYWLRPEGFLFLTTPNIESWDAKILGRYWYGYTKTPEHINYFSPRSIEIVLRQTGFTVHRINTWGFIRTLEFIFEKIDYRQLPFLNWLRSICKVLGISRMNIYFPVTDMIIVAERK